MSWERRRRDWTSSLLENLGEMKAPADGRRFRGGKAFGVTAMKRKREEGNQDPNQKKKKIKQAEQDSPIDLVEKEKEKEKEKAMRMMEIQQLGWCLLEE